MNRIDVTYDSIVNYQYCVQRNLSWYFIFFLYGLLSLPISEAHAGFCWIPNSDNDCRINRRDGVDFPYLTHQFYVLNPFVDNKLTSLPIKFRSDCHFPAWGCRGQNWALSLENIHYTVNSQVHSPSFNVNIRSHSNRIRENWQVKKKPVTGTSNNLNRRGVSEDFYLSLTFSKEQMAQLLPGLHTVELIVKGSDIENTVVERTMTYRFSFIIEEKVHISGLEKIGFGTFLDDNFDKSLNAIVQPVCVYVQGGGGFSITTSSKNGDYVLIGQHPDNKIRYGVGLKPNKNRATQLTRGESKRNLTHISYEVKTRAYNMKGSLDVSCNNLSQENMLLSVWLNETFESLSTTPAGQYTDTLTLTVAPD